jgi:hypothetical protein
MISSPLSLTLYTYNPQLASSHCPGGAPGPHLPAARPPYLTILSPSRRSPSEHAHWRLRRQQQTSRYCRARALPETPPSSPNQRQPTTLPVGPSTALALTAPCMHRVCRERALHSRSCTHAHLSSRTRACTASNVQHHATLALHDRALTHPGRVTILVHVD